MKKKNPTLAINFNAEVFPHVSFVEKLVFTKHLSVMIKSGIALSEALQVLREQTKNKFFRAILSEIQSDVQNGQPLYKSLQKFPKIFDTLFVNLIKIGEESGTLEGNLEYLAIELKKNYEFKKKVKGALMYPSIVLLTAFIVGGGIAVFVLPKLVDLFDSLDVKLPLSTKILLFIAQTMKDYGVVIMLGLAAAILLLKLFTQLPSIKPLWLRFLLSIPVFGTFLQNSQMSALARNFGIMLKSGLPIMTALKELGEGTPNLVYKSYIEKVRSGLERGASIEESLVKMKAKYFPLIATKMIGVGEKTGRLDESLIYLGDFFEGEVDDQSKNFSTILEPILLLVIGLVVAFVALSIISPIYQLTGSIQK